MHTLLMYLVLQRVSLDCTFMSFETHLEQRMCSEKLFSFVVIKLSCHSHAVTDCSYIARNLNLFWLFPDDQDVLIT